MAKIAITPGEGTGTIYLSHKNTNSEITLYLPTDSTSATLLTKEKSDATLANYVTQDAMEEYVGLHGSSVPTGTIMFFAGSTAPEGFIVWQNIKIYQTQYPNLYAVLNTAGGFAKGTDSTGAYVTLPDINGRVLQATTSASQVGALLEAGLPNITGGTQLQYPSKIRGFENFTGAFKSNNLNRGGDWGDYGQGGPMGFLFDASLADDKYGSSDSIQTASAYALMIIKE